MAKFITDYQVLLFGLVKILIMLGYFLSVAPVLVFAERRQAALIQDRVGPNRAMVTVPGLILKGALATPAILLGLIVLGVAFVLYPMAPLPDSPGRFSGVVRGFWLLELAIFLAWSHALVLTGVVRAGRAMNPLETSLDEMEEPRWLFYLGAIANVLVVVAYLGFADTPSGARAFAMGGPVPLAVVLLIIGGYLGYRIPSGPIDLRAAGLLHSMADTLKLAFKEDFIPLKADKLLHALAPMISLFPALVTYAIIPFGDALCFGQTPEGYLDLTSPLAQASRMGSCTTGRVDLQIADLNVGILYLFALGGTGIVGAAIAGWSSDNKWSLLGGLRAASQMVSYEVAMGLSLVGAFMIYGSTRLADMVRWQSENAWGIFVQPLAFFLFFAAAIAEQKRTPFDAPEGESEIVAGYFLEYSSMKFVMFYTGEYVEVMISSAVLVTIFLGGWTLPFLHRDGVTVALGDSVLWQASLGHVAVTLIGVITFFVKVTLLSFGQIFIRWTLPRFRYDQIMSLGWKLLLPASIANLVVTGLVTLVIDQAGPAVTSTMHALADVTQFIVVIAFAVVVLRFMLLLLAPAPRGRFTKSTSAARAARLGGIKEGPMQALGPRAADRGTPWEAES